MRDAASDKKADALTALAKERQAALWPSESGYLNLSEYYQGRFECDFVSPYSRLAGNSNSDILIFLKDWTGTDEKEPQELDDMGRYGRSPNRPTNRNLDALLLEFFGKTPDQLYITNLFPFVKPGNMTETISPEHLRRSAIEFAVPHIDILCPRLVIVLGPPAAKAIAYACGQSNPNQWSPPHAKPFQRGQSMVWAQYHPASWTRSVQEKMRLGWRSMSEWFFSHSMGEH